MVHPSKKTVALRTVAVFEAAKGLIVLLLGLGVLRLMHKNLDDFAENRGGWDRFAATMAHVIPEGRWVELDGANPIFHAFFEIPSPHDFLPPYDRGYHPGIVSQVDSFDPRCPGPLGAGSPTLDGAMR